MKTKRQLGLNEYARLGLETSGVSPDIIETLGRNIKKRQRMFLGGVAVSVISILTLGINERNYIWSSKTVCAPLSTDKFPYDASFEAAAVLREKGANVKSIAVSQAVDVTDLGNLVCAGAHDGLFGEVYDLFAVDSKIRVIAPPSLDN